MEGRKKLPIPWEYNLWVRCSNSNSLPLAGGILDQPHIVMMCFNIINSEVADFREQKKKIREVNKRLADAHKRKAGK